MSSFGSVSSISSEMFGWQGPQDQARRAARAVVESAEGDALSRRMDFARAYERYRQAVELDPSKADYHFRFGVTTWRLGRQDIAERSLLETIRIAPDYADAHDALGQLYMESRQLDRALQYSASAVRLDPKDIDYVITRGSVLAADGQITAAWELIKPLIEAGAKHPRLSMLYARLAAGIGREREALAAVEWALQSGVHQIIEMRLRFDAAGLLDRLGRYDKAFTQARRANEMAGRKPDPSANADTDRKIAYFTQERMRRLPRSAANSRRMVLIVGMPRSGTTLVEQILASHPRVHGAGESHVLAEICENLSDPKWADGAAFPESLDMLSVSSATRLAQHYLSALEAPEAANAAYIIDKTPLNCLHLGLAELLLPDCHVIHCTRTPLDTCLSCYLTNFASGHDYAYDLESLGAMFRNYQRLMAHWKQVLKVPIHEVRYEDLVLDLKGQSRRLTDFLNLPWDEHCLKFYENKRRVHTASKDQVRQPIYLSSVARWKNYEKHLTKLIDSLTTT